MLSPAAAALAVVLVVLLVTIDDRHVGRTADERQVIWAAVAVTTTGQLSQAREHDFAYVSPDGRAVSRYGIGMTLLEVPAAWLAPRVERVMGPGSSQPLFLAVPVLLVLLAAWLSGRAARMMGGGEWAAGLAVLLTGIGSPFGAYAGMAFSEPLQGAMLTAAFAAALGCAAAGDPRREARWALVAGAAAGASLLAKSLLLAVAPFALLPLLRGTNRRDAATRLAYSALGAAPGVIAWAWFEWIRFGRLFGSYPGEGFTHPFPDGLWRLLGGPNTGLVLFFPALAIVLWRWGGHLARRRWHAALTEGGAVLPFLLLLALSAGWWAWHGVWGWGPRLLVPAVPSLAAVAAVAVPRRTARAGGALLAVSILVNLPGLLQHPVPVLNYVSNLAWPVVPASEARGVAGYARTEGDDGTIRIAPDQVLARVPQASPFVVFPWFFRVATLNGDLDAAGRALEAPPWAAARPDMLPAVRPMTAAWLGSIIGTPRARYWGRGFWPSAADVRYAAVYDEGVEDQVIRLLQDGRAARALEVARGLADLAPVGNHDALVLECYRTLRDRAGASAYLQGLPGDRRSSGAINVVLALFERDAGNEPFARRLLASVVDRFLPTAPIRRAVEAPLEQWPPDLIGMIQGRVKGAGEQ